MDCVIDLRVSIGCTHEYTLGRTSPRAIANGFKPRVLVPSRTRFQRSAGGLDGSFGAFAKNRKKGQ